MLRDIRDLLVFCRVEIGIAYAWSPGPSSGLLTSAPQSANFVSEHHTGDIAGNWGANGRKFAVCQVRRHLGYLGFQLTA